MECKAVEESSDKEKALALLDGNIITGGEPLYNNRFEQFQINRDYARKRN